jgi:hypothetical protein
MCPNLFRLVAHDGRFKRLFEFMLFNNILAALFINVAQHAQHTQQQVYVSKLSMVYVSMSGPQQAASPQEEVKIKLKHRDWEVEITCVESKVKQIVENVLSGIDNSTTLDTTLDTKISELKKDIEYLKLQISSGDINQISVLKNSMEPERKALQRGGTTCRGLLETLWYERYFETEKPLREVHEELSRRGYNYDRTAVSHSLTDMVRESILTRVGTMRNYQYIQKRPPSESQL